MIILSGVLVVVAIALLVVGIIAGNSESAQIGGLEALTLIYISIAVSIVSLLCLFIGVILRRRELFGPTGATTTKVKQPKKRDRKGEPAAAAGATATMPVAAGDMGDDLSALPMPQADVPDDAIVHVVRGRKRYHLDSCRQLAGRDKEELTYAEAIEEGFSPCTACLPDTALAARAAAAGQTAASAGKDDRDAETTKAFASPSAYAGSGSGAAPSVPPAREEPTGRSFSERGTGVPSAWPVPGAAAGQAASDTGFRSTASGWKRGPAPEPSAEWDAQAEDYPETPLDIDLNIEVDETIDQTPTRADIPRPAEPLGGRSVFERTRPEPEPAGSEPGPAESDIEDTAPAPEVQPAAEPYTGTGADVGAEAEPIFLDDAFDATGGTDTAESTGTRTDDEIGTVEREDGEGDAQGLDDGPADADEVQAEDDADEAGGEQSGAATRTSEPQVRILSGTKRYHRSDCALIEDIGDDADDLEALSRAEAKARGCTPCLVCQPDKEHADN